MPNIEEPNFKVRGGPPGFQAKRARIGYELGAERVGVSLWELPPGETAYPYHFHYVDEEIVIVLEGRPILRTPGGERELAQGEAVRFELGPEGAHQISNPGTETVRFLAVSNHGMPDLVAYPDSNKLGAGERRPEGGGLHAFFDLDAQVDYWDGEEPPTSGPGDAS